jgi:hypothetical protein
MISRVGEADHEGELGAPSLHGRPKVILMHLGEHQEVPIWGSINAVPPRSVAMIFNVRYCTWKHQMRVVPIHV